MRRHLPRIAVALAFAALLALLAWRERHHARLEQSVANEWLLLNGEYTKLEQESDAWRAAATVTIRRLATQDDLYAHGAIIVAVEHLSDVGLFPGAPESARSVLTIPVPQQGERAFALDGDNVRLLPPGAFAR